MRRTRAEMPAASSPGPSHRCSGALALGCLGAASDMVGEGTEGKLARGPSTSSVLEVHGSRPRGGFGAEFSTAARARLSFVGVGRYNQPNDPLG